MDYVLSLDLGTSSVRASLFDLQGRPVPDCTEALRHEPETTADGGVELDPDRLVESAVACVEAVVRQAGPRAAGILGVGCCTFWHSVLGVDASGRAVTPVLMWADTRSVREVEEIRAQVDVAAVHRRTGCPLHTSFLAPRLLWVRRHRPEWLQRISHWMSPGEYLYSRLFGHRVCSLSMASGTGLFNQETGRWDEEMMGLAGVEPAQLSPVQDTLTPLGAMSREWSRRLAPLGDVPWFPAAGDGACSNLGSGCSGPDRMALMGGTSGALRVMCRRGAQDAPATEPAAPEGLFKYRLDSPRYVVGGSLSNAGNLFAWLKSTLRVPEGAALEAAIAAEPADGHGLTVLPFLAGERCPGWRGDARAAVTGASLDTTPLEVLRAGLESVAFRFALIHERLMPIAAQRHTVVATGGALLASPAWIQIVADALGETVVASGESEASSRGAALLALQGVGRLAEPDDLPQALGREFVPNPAIHERYVAARRRQAELYRRLLGPECQDEGV